MRRPLLLPILLIAPAGCATTAMMRSIPLDAGIEARYAVPADTLVAALPAVLGSRGLKLVGPPERDSNPTMLIAASNPGFFSYGEYVRVLAETRPHQPRGVARVVARSRYLLDASGRVDRVAPRLLQALDAALGRDALGPFAGDRIRARAATGAPLVQGRVVEDSAGALLLAPAGGAPMPISDLTDVAIYRGRYAHRAEGATVGFVLGLAVGIVVASNTGTGDDPYGYAGLVKLSIVMAGGGIGTIAGAVVGTAIHSTVWSEVR